MKPARRRWTLLRQRLAVPAALVLVLVAGCALFAGAIAPYDPQRQDYLQVLQPPNPAHPMGTDDLGRDVLTRVIYGSRISVSVGLVAVGMSVAVGVPLGLLAAYRRDWLDDLIMRAMDALSGFPELVLAWVSRRLSHPGC